MFCLKTSRHILSGSKLTLSQKLLSSFLTSESVVIKVTRLEQTHVLRSCHSLAKSNISILHRLASAPNFLHKVLMSSSNKEDTKPETASNDASAKPAAELSLKDKLKFAVRDYGATVIVFHITISLISLGGFYLAASSGINVEDMVQSIGFDSSISAATVGSAGTFVVAYAIHKVFAPVRITITLTAAPFIVRYLRSKGILKVKPKNSQ